MRKLAHRILPTSFVVGLGLCVLTMLMATSSAEPPKPASITRIGYRLSKVVTIAQATDNDSRGWQAFYEAVPEADGSIQVYTRKGREKQWHIWPKEHRAALYRDFGKDAILGNGTLEVVRWTEPPQELWTDKDYTFEAAVKAEWKDNRRGCIVGGLQYYTEPPGAFVLADGSRTRVEDLPPFKLNQAGDVGGKTKIIPQTSASVTVRPRFDPANAPLKHGFMLCLYLFSDCNPPTFKTFYYYDQIPLDEAPGTGGSGGNANGSGTAGGGGAGTRGGGNNGNRSGAGPGGIGGIGSAGNGGTGNGGNASGGTSTAGGGTTSGSAAGSRLTLQAGKRQVAPGGSVWVPVWLRNAADVANINFTLSYDPAVVQPDGEPVRGNLLTNVLFSANAKESGIVRAGFAGTSGVNDTGTVAYVKFRAVGQAGDKTAIHVQATRADDSHGTKLAPDCIDGSIQIVRPDGLLPGDYDGDGRLTELDALAALQMSVRLIPEDLILDMDNDGQVTSRDAVLILQRAVQGDPKR